MAQSIPERVNQWINERIPLNKMINEGLHEQIPGGTRFSYTLGSACLFLLTIQIVTGLWQMFFYVPTVDYAYSSLSYMRFKVPFGWLVHGLHYWGAHAFTVIVGLHVMRVFVWGAYKKPREIIWLAGVFLILMTVGFMFTGPVLAWDKKGFWAGQVGLGIAGSVPLVGPFTQHLLQGASQMGQLALLRMFVLHVAVIPMLTGVFVMIHLFAFRQYSSVGPWNPEKRKKTGYFWPEQLFKDAVVALGIFIMLVGLAAFRPAEITGMADPMDTLYMPKPEWNFYFLYEALKYFPGKLLPLGTVGIPTVMLLLLFSLPFLDKSPERNPLKRGFVMLVGFCFVAFVVSFTWFGYKSHQAPAEVVAQFTKSDNHGHIPKEKVHAIEKANAQTDITGEQLFKTLGCTECHTVAGIASSKQGPDLLMAKKENRTKSWMCDQLMYPQKHNQKTIMPPYAHLSQRNIDLLIEYLSNLTPPKKSPVSVTAAAADKVATGSEVDQKGEELFTVKGCVQCHTLKGRKTNKAGPDMILSMVQNNRTRDWLRRQMVAPQEHNPTTIMPSFATRMTDDEMSLMLSFLQSLSTRKLSQATDTLSADEESTGEFKTGVGPAVAIVGNREHGAVLYQQSCIMCHGPQGKTNALNHKPEKGVPSLNPINPARFSTDPEIFAQRIDVFVQHGIPNTQGGPNMPAFGDTYQLTQPQIADIEAYVMHLNGVDRAMIYNPGVEPKEFFFIILCLPLVILGLAWVLWVILKNFKM